MNEASVFRHLIAAVAPHDDPLAEATAISYARSFKSRLTFLVVEDETMRQAVGLPFVQELDIHGCEWHTIDCQSVEQHWAKTTHHFVRRLAQRIERAGFIADVKLRRGEKFDRDGEPGDVLLLIEPSEPLARVARPFVSDLAAAIASDKDLLFVPHSVHEGAGPIAAIQSAASDLPASIGAVAAHLMNRQLIVLEEEAIAVAIEKSHRAIADALGPQRACLLVMERTRAGINPAQAVALATEQRTPLLLLAPRLRT